MRLDGRLDGTDIRRGNVQLLSFLMGTSRVQKRKKKRKSKKKKKKKAKAKAKAKNGANVAEC